MSSFILDLDLLYRQTFGGKPYKISDTGKSPELPPFKIDATNNTKNLSRTGTPLYETYLGKEIWFPTRFYGLKNIGFAADQLLLPYCTIHLSGSKSMIKTSLAERSGTVKELFNVDDYSISIKGFAIDDKNRIFPEDELNALRLIFESSVSLGLDNAISNIFLTDQKNGCCQVVAEKFELKEVSGGRSRVRPFSISLVNDSAFNLILDK